jgi:hypothetical protein
MWRRKATTAAGITAAAGQIRSASNVTSAKGMRMRSRGKMQRLTGSARRVMRWK